MAWTHAGALGLFALPCKYNYTKVLGAFCGVLYLAALIPALSGPLIALIARINSWCETRSWFRWPAELSYSGYLTHGIIFALIFGWRAAELSASNVSTTRFIVVFVAVLLLINLIGVALYFGTEKPGINFGKTLLARLLTRWN